MNADSHATRVAAAIRRKATYHQLTPTRRANADTAATYLVNKAPYLDCIEIALVPDA